MTRFLHFSAAPNSFKTCRGRLLEEIQELISYFNQKREKFFCSSVKDQNNLVGGKLASIFVGFKTQIPYISTT